MVPTKAWVDFCSPVPLVRSDIQQSIEERPISAARKGAAVQTGDQGEHQNAQMEIHNRGSKDVSRQRCVCFDSIVLFEVRAC